VSPAHQSHPEFEYFRPFLSFLRKAGIAVALISFAVIGGALVLRAGHDSTADMALMTARGSDIPSSAPTASTANRAAAITAAERPPLPEAGAAACEQDTWAYLDGKCILPFKARKARSGRAATDGLLGRSALPAPAASRLPKLATGADAAASAPEAVKPTGPAPKKARKTASGQTGGQDAGKSKERARDEQWNARAYASPDSRNPAGPYERSWGWTR
jgi:hypothetical protein